MPWWLYVVIGFWVGVLAGNVLTRIFYYSKWPEHFGSIVIMSDPDRPNNTDADYVFLQAKADPEELRKLSEVTLTVVDKTGRRK